MGTLEGVLGNWTHLWECAPVAFPAKKGELASEPKIQELFGTTNAVGAIDNMGDDCDSVGAAKGLYAAEPDVTVTIK